MIGDQEIQNLLGDTVLNQIRSGTTSGGRAGEQIWIKTSKGSIQGTCIKDLAPGECTGFLADDGQWYITGGDTGSEVNNSRQISYRRTVQSEPKKEPIVAILYSVTEVVEEERPCICSDRWFFLGITDSFSDYLYRNYGPGLYRRVCYDPVLRQPVDFRIQANFPPIIWSYNYDYRSQEFGFATREDAIANSPLFRLIDIGVGGGNSETTVNGTRLFFQNEFVLPPVMSNSFAIENTFSLAFRCSTIAINLEEATTVTLNVNLNSTGSWIVEHQSKLINQDDWQSQTYESSGNEISFLRELAPGSHILIASFEATSEYYTSCSGSITGVPTDLARTPLKHFYLKVGDRTNKIFSARRDDVGHRWLTAQKKSALLRIPSGTSISPGKDPYPSNSLLTYRDFFYCHIKSFEQLAANGTIKEEVLNNPDLPSKDSWQKDFIIYDAFFVFSEIPTDNPCAKDYIGNLGANIIKDKTLYICNLDQLIDGRRLGEILKTEPAKARVEKRFLNVVEDECQKGEPKFINLKIDALGVDKAVNPQDVGLGEGQTIDPESIEIEAISIFI